MGYLNIDSITLNLNKAVVSLWFRIPQSTFDAAEADYTVGINPPENEFLVLVGVIPLVVFGPQQSGAAGTGAPTTATAPSYIGVQVLNDPAQSTLIAANLQFPDVAVWSDPTQRVGTIPAYLGNSGQESGYGGNGAPVLKAHWNHLILSWDVGSGTYGEVGYRANVFYQTYTSSARMWCALNDVNKNGSGLPAFTLIDCYGNDPPAGLDPNAIFNSDVAGWLAPGNVDENGDNTESATTTFGTLPVGPLSAPGPAKLIRGAGSIIPVRHVEMAELQVFAGITLDTSVEANRRLFVDANGKPVPPNQKKSGAKTSGSIEGLGQTPDVMLHGSGNWIKGKNTGSTGADPHGAINPAGQFTPTGDIKAYKPDPSLEGPQGHAAGLVRLSVRA